MKKNIRSLGVLGLTIALTSPFCISGNVNAQTRINNDNPQLELYEYSYKNPVSPYLVNPEEKVVNIKFKGGDCSELQSLIDDARKQDAKGVIVVEVSGKVVVNKEPLKIGSYTNLLFSRNGGMVNGGNDELESLINIQTATSSSITSEDGAILDGKKLTNNVIVVRNGSLIQMDQLTIVGAKNSGIMFLGNGDNVVDETSSLTRSTIKGSGASGLSIRNSARFMVIDNTFENNGDLSVLAVSESAIITGNRFSNSNIGLQLDGARMGIEGPGAVVARNRFEECQVGLRLGKYAENFLITENIASRNEVGMTIYGACNHIYNNTMINEVEFKDMGRSNVIANNIGVLETEIDASKTTSYFNPPTAKNPHRDQTIVMGMGRIDVEVNQEANTPSVDLKKVQTLLDETREANPSKYVVMWLKGNFVATGEYTGLDMPENSSIVLDGVIYPEGSGMDRRSKDDHYAKFSTTGGTQLVLMKEKGFVSFSGGKIDCKNMPAYGIYAPGNNVCVIDGVAIHEAADNEIGTLHHFKPETPVFISGCDFNGFGTSNRAVWVHICDFVHCIGNTSKNHFADYVDIDAEGHNNTVLFNTTYNERRCGVFVEENATNNVMLGNTFTGNIGTGISLYSSLGQVVKNNILVGNNFIGTNGMNIRHARNTLSFNNNIEPSKKYKLDSKMVVGRYGVYLNVEDNVSVNNCLKGTMNMSQNEDNSFFNTPNIK